MARGHDRGRGFTLVETLMATAVLAMAVAAISQAIVSGQMQTYNALHEQRALSLGESLLEEIEALPYADPQGAAAAGPDSGETSRALFDNSDDYHNYTQAAGAQADVAGTTYDNNYQVFTRSVTCTYGTATVTSLGTINGLTVVVTVRNTKNRTWTLTRFIPQPAP